jgi:hypothetical protein
MFFVKFPPWEREKNSFLLREGARSQGFGSFPQHAHADANISKRQRRRSRFSFFLVLPSPKEGGGVGWGRVQQQQQKSAAAAASAAAARQGLNEINTAITLNRFLTCGVVVF